MQAAGAVDVVVVLLPLLLAVHACLAGTMQAIVHVMQCFTVPVLHIELCADHCSCRCRWLLIGSHP